MDVSDHVMTGVIVECLSIVCNVHIYSCNRVAQ